MSWVERDRGKNGQVEVLRVDKKERGLETRAWCQREEAQYRLRGGRQEGRMVGERVKCSFDICLETRRQLNGEVRLGEGSWVQRQWQDEKQFLATAL